MEGIRTIIVVIAALIHKFLLIYASLSCLAAVVSKLERIFVEISVGKIAAKAVNNHAQIQISLRLASALFSLVAVPHNQKNHDYHFILFPHSI